MEGALHLGGVAQQGSGMDHRHHEHALLLEPCSVLAGDTQIGLDEPHPGDPAESHDDARPDQARLLPEVGKATLLLALFGVAVVRRAALDDIGDVNILMPVEVDGVQHLVEELSCSADKGFALQILLFARPFANEHHPRRAIADAEDNVMAPIA